ncbi:DNA-dependent RNA polymerase, partial [Klebsiella pneumoniae]|nr:DNA-dependent RNA polymerase [Klebsiella pneumoniae]
MSSEAIALLTIKVVLGTLTDASKATIQQVSSQLGKALEDEARFGRIREQEAAYFKKNVADQLDKRVGHVYKKAFMQVVEADMISKGMLGGHNWDSWKT